MMVNILTIKIMMTKVMMMMMMMMSGTCNVGAADHEWG